MQDDLSLTDSQPMKKPVRECSECGSPYGRHWQTPDGTATLCPTCAQFYGLGCP